MSSFLLQEANNRNSAEKFTLHCGELNDVVNIDDNVDKDLLGGFCALRTGKNFDFIKANNNNPRGDIFLAFESQNLNSQFLENLNQSILGVFETLYDEDMNVNLDCSNANIDPAGDEFFQICDFEAENFRDGAVYYNKPLKIALLASDELDSTSFFQEFWSALVGFFEKMFGEDNKDESYLTLKKC